MVLYPGDLVGASERRTDACGELGAEQIVGHH
jgi:hypothetical protein